MKFCPKCGYEHKKEAQFCGKCGNSFRDVAENKPLEEVHKQLDTSDPHFIEKQRLQVDFDRYLREFWSYQESRNMDAGQATVNKVNAVLTASDQAGYNDLTAKFATEISNILTPTKHPEASHFIDMAVTRIRKVDDKRLKRDILLQAGNNYSNIGMFDQAVQSYLEARKYSDVEINIAEEVKKLSEGGKLSSFGIKSEDFYALMTLNAAKCMDPHKDETLRYFEEAKKLCAELKTPGILGIVDFEQGIVYYNRNDFEKAIELFESAKKIWQKENPDLIAQYQVDLQIEGLKQKLASGETKAKRTPSQEREKEKKKLLISGNIPEDLEQFEEYLKSKSEEDIEQSGIKLTFQLQEITALEESEELLTKIEEVCSKYDNNYFPALGNQIMAHRYLSIQDFAQAGKLIDKALDFISKTDDKMMHLAILDNVAMISRQLEDVDKAIKAYEEALDLYLIPESEEHQYVLFQINIQYRETLLQSNYKEKAKDILEETREKLKLGFDPYSYCTNSIFVAHSMIRFEEDLNEVVAHIFEAINICMLERYKHQFITALYLKGTAQVRATHYTHAVDTYKKALEGCKHSNNSKLGEMIQMELDMLAKKIADKFAPVVVKKGKGYGVEMGTSPNVLDEASKYYDYEDIKSCIRLTNKYETIKGYHNCHTLLNRASEMYSKHKDKKGLKKLKSLKASLKLI
ncbi:MAG: hypothetical protein GPJ51_13235 [Candidatus Heimdallarchaeota archaeon]|nr:hypothetical protein [Candidatus Heimdallarchaeota archaeon]